MKYSRRVARAFFTQTAVARAVSRAVMRPRLRKVRRARVRRAKSLTASPKSQEARRYGMHTQLLPERGVPPERCACGAALSVRFWSFKFHLEKQSPSFLVLTCKLAR